jgi:hypothetical protein
MKNKLFAEFFGTFWLVFGGCGSAVLRRCSYLGRLARQPRHRLRRRIAGVRPHRDDHGLCHRPHLRLPPQPRRHDRPCRQRATPGLRGHPLHHRPGDRRHRRRRGALSDRQRQEGFTARTASPPTVTAISPPANTRWSPRSSRKSCSPSSSCSSSWVPPTSARRKASRRSPSVSASR